MNRPTMDHPAIAGIEACPSLAALLPVPVAAMRCTIPLAGASLWPSEEAAIAQAVAKRRDEFTAGRACARHCLIELGLEPAPIPVGEMGMPLWPDGVTGSITHSDGIAMAVALRDGAVRSLGIDIEPASSVTDAMHAIVLTPAERDALPPQDRAIAATALFAAKEAFYKAQFPISRRFVDYREVGVELAEGRFSVQVQSDIPSIGAAGQRFDGRWCMLDGHVLTAIAL
ncbi:4'-phosphopantetheinyl transferase [Croceicoccus sp. Ery5]|uniref:4'-phosphopantetheinyl transferase family protein n=1 Tax=Croceicoccus sp. Ery5 TaxID=1703340 RepID=UPI001E556FFA|nr:4'-phosphopantetheinyl transferase superfamily protein [Croceicoccus sp. Ery5]